MKLLNSRLSKLAVVDGAQLQPQGDQICGTQKKNG